ncbi:MAG TPA: CoA transferase [Dehalococcoidia bacterium]|nr:CoA transferase [Dehalococcoidia bacterium]
MSGPLDGYRVVELAEGVAGPYCAMALGDAGADVIKIEPPAGDRARGWGPPLRGDTSAVFLSLNRNKRGVVLDLAKPGGIESARGLLANADVAVIDANRLPAPELGYDAMAAFNQRLVCCQISGYGDRGPWANRPAGELPAQLLSEATSSLGHIGEEPVRLGTDVASMYAANYAVQAICAALLEREQSGLGQRIDVSLFGSMLAMRSTLWVALSNPDEWWGFHLDSYVKPPDQGYRCKDGAIFFSLARMERERFDALLRELDMEWVRDDPLYPLLERDTAGGTGRHAHEVKHLWERAFAAFTTAQVTAIVERLGGTCFPMNDYAQLVALPQVQHLGMVQEIEQPGIGPLRVLAPPWEFSETPASIRRPAPRLGEHTAEILREIASSEARP